MKLRFIEKILSEKDARPIPSCVEEFLTGTCRGSDDRRRRGKKGKGKNNVPNLKVTGLWHKTRESPAMLAPGPQEKDLPSTQTVILLP
jgi:hypothetical protein